MRHSVAVLGCGACLLISGILIGLSMAPILGGTGEEKTTPELWEKVAVFSRRGSDVKIYRVPVKEGVCYVLVGGTDQGGIACLK